VYANISLNKFRHGEIISWRKYRPMPIIYKKIHTQTMEQNKSCWRLVTRA